MFEDKSGDNTVTNDEVTQRYYYYPFGAETKNAPWTQQASPTVRYQYNGKEKIDELGLGWNDYGARNYDALLGRWMGVDALAEKYMGYSGYNYVLGNPISLIDPDGRWPKDPRAAAWAYVCGIGNGLHSNMTANFPGVRKDPEEFGSYSDYAAAGQTAGDVFSIGIGTIQTGLSVLAIGAEAAAVPVTGGASASAIPETTAIAVHGATTIISAAKHLGDPGKVEAGEHSYARQKGVKEAWKQEKDMVGRTEEGTRNWTEPQKVELAAKGKVKGFEGHHINSVFGRSAENAANPDNILFFTRKEHLAEHGGNFKLQTTGDLISRK